MEPPLLVSDGELCWVRTEIRRGPDLVDGSGWIAEFQKRCREAPALSGRARLLRQTVSEGDNPQFWSKAGDTPLPLRNEVLKVMQKEKGQPGSRAKLATGQDVIFWFNVGPPGEPRNRVYVTDARCPHQGVCLLEGELKDIEDVAGTRRGMVRCPRHNKTFDIQSGQSPGNSEELRVYPCRFEHGHWYVGVSGRESEAAQAVDVEMPAAEEPEQKRQRIGSEVIAATPAQGRPRILVHHATIA
ncbi:unnamed protein product [Polarella glacialis]|uniref:Rieske domain-containing protein n=2 Tax=Polarella glacialis TaxID=89957 RepID=A0A813HRZ0_POLGL|nr:unnamed protein product [Polarella glacialis]